MPRQIHLQPPDLLSLLPENGSVLYLSNLSSLGERLNYAIERGDLEIIRSNLPYGTINMKPKRKGKRKRMAYRALRDKSITKRPPAAELRIKYSHWETDTVVGRTGGSSACLLVTTERTTREEIIRRLPDRSQRSVIRALRSLERLPENFFTSMRRLTYDNGSEFWDFAAIELSSLKPKDTRTRSTTPIRSTPSNTVPMKTTAASSAASSPRDLISPTSVLKQSASSNRKSTPWNAILAEASQFPKPKEANSMNQPPENLQMHLTSKRRTNRKSLPTSRSHTFEIHLPSTPRLPLLA